MKKTFLQVTFMICIGIAFSIVGCMLVSGKTNTIQNSIVYAAGSGYTIEIDTGDIDLLDDSLIRIKRIEPEPSAVPEEFLGVKTFTDVKEDTIISITASSDSVFEFKGFIYNDEDCSVIKDGIDGPELRFTVTGDIAVKVVFTENSFDTSLIISALYGVEDVPLGNSVRFKFDNGAEENYEEYTDNGLSIKPGQTLEYITFDGIDGYRFDDILIKPKGSDYKTFWLDSLNETHPQDKIAEDGTSITYNYDRPLDSNFFDDYRSINSEILIVINLEKLCKLDFVYQSTMGHVVVDESADGGVTWSEDVGTSKYFEIGTKLRVTAVPEAFQSFNGFNRLDPAETDPINGNPNVYVFSIYDNRTINLNFTANTYEIDSNLNFTASKSNFHVGETVTFTYNVPSNHEIKEWKLFNSDRTIKFGSNVVKRSGNSVSVTLTGDMLSSNGKFVLKHEVTDSLKPGVIIGIVVPSVILPLLIIILATFVIIDRRRKKVIKAALEGKWTELRTKDVGGFVSALREGKDGTVSKADIKKEMKQQKQEKKQEEKPVKQEKQPKEKPAKVPTPAKQASAVAAVTKAAPTPKPVAAAIPNLDGCAILPNRTLVDKNKKKIGTLQKDGSIADLNGRQFAKASLTTGEIMDNSNKVIGIVQEDGSIKKP